MSLRDWIAKLRAPAPPVIMTEWGPVTEGARKQAARNMAADPELRARCEAAMVLKVGDLQKGLEKMRHDFPEAYENDTK
jgi:hypothetical protein